MALQLMSKIIIQPATQINAWSLIATYAIIEFWANLCIYLSIHLFCSFFHSSLKIIIFPLKLNILKQLIYFIIIFVCFCNEPLNL